jgi:hypothetical protein
MKTGNQGSTKKPSMPLPCQGCDARCGGYGHPGSEHHSGCALFGDIQWLPDGLVRNCIGTKGLAELQTHFPHLVEEIAKLPPLSRFQIAA